MANDGFANAKKILFNCHNKWFWLYANRFASFVRSSNIWKMFVLENYMVKDIKETLYCAVLAKLWVCASVLWGMCIEVLKWRRQGKLHSQFIDKDSRTFNLHHWLLRPTTISLGAPRILIGNWISSDCSEILQAKSESFPKCMIYYFSLSMGNVLHAADMRSRPSC